MHHYCNRRFLSKVHSIWIIQRNSPQQCSSVHRKLQMLTMLCACCLIMAAMRKAHSTTKLPHVPFVCEHRRDMARDGNDRQLARNWKALAGRSRLQLCGQQTKFTFFCHCSNLKLLSSRWTKRWNSWLGQRLFLWPQVGLMYRSLVTRVCNTAGTTTGSANYCHSATFSTKYSTRTKVGFNPGGEWLLEVWHRMKTQQLRKNRFTPWKSTVKTGLSAECVQMTRKKILPPNIVWQARERRNVVGRRKGKTHLWRTKTIQEDDIQKDLKERGRRARTGFIRLRIVPAAHTCK
jgi:hypothetical protein